MLEPVVVSIELPSSDLLVRNDRELLRERRQQILDAVADATMTNLNRLVVLNPVAGQLRYESLPAGERALLGASYRTSVASVYERAMVNFLSQAIKELRVSTAVSAITVQGLPVEPLHSSLAEAISTNERYLPVIRELDAFVQPHLQHNCIAREQDTLDNLLPESWRLNSGQPIVFVSGSTWRIFVTHPRTLAEEAFFGYESLANIASLFEDAAGAIDAVDRSQASGHGIAHDSAHNLGVYETAASELLTFLDPGNLPYVGHREPPTLFCPQPDGGPNDDEPCDDPNYNPWENLHDFTGLPMTCNGWTDLSALYNHPDLYTNSRIIYVSSSQGSNSNGVWYTPGDTAIGPDPFNPSVDVQPYSTISAGLSQVRDGFADILLLKRGDIWEEGDFFLNVVGPSQLERIIIGEYGSASARPEIRTGDANGFWNHGSGKAANIIFAHLHLNSDGRTPDGGGTGFRPRGAPGDHLLIEGCLIREFSNNITINPQTQISHVVIRRNVLVDAYDTGSHAQGIYASSNTNDMLIEENVLDHNGWHPTIQEANIHSHNIYLNASVNRPTVRRNIITRASSHGTQLGFGGDAIENVYSHNPIALIMSRDPSVPVVGRALRNVILEGTDMGSTARGFGIQIKRAEDVRAEENIISTIGNASSPNSFRLNEESNIVASQLIRLQDNIVYNWGGSGIRIYGTSESQSIQLLGNTVVNMLNGDPGVRHSNDTTLSIVTADANLFDLSAPIAQQAQVGSNTMTVAAWSEYVSGSGGQSQSIDFPDPDRTLGTYADTIDLTPTFDAFIDEARKQSRANWNPELTAPWIINYIRDGFGLEPLEQK